MSTPLADALPFAVLSGLLFALLLAIVIAAGERVLAVRLSAMAPAARIRLLSALLVAPTCGGVAYAGAALLSAFNAANQGLMAAACADHGGSVWHACVWHPASADGDTLAWLLGSAATLLGIALVRSALSLQRARRALAALVRLARPADGALVVDLARPIAMTAGLGGHVLLSQALVDRLDARQLRIVLAHELAHVAHRDVLRRWLVGGLSGLHWPATRRRLDAALALAMEQRCDRMAAEVDGSPLVVAETIIAVERLHAAHAAQPAPTLHVAACFVDGFVDARVRALLGPQAPEPRGLGTILLACALAIAAASNGTLHHTTEFLLAVVLA